jgi:hypothetical protein
MGYLSALFKKSILKVYVAIDKFVAPPYTTCMGTFIDLTGKTFGRLTVMARAANSKDNKAVFLCRCSCGREIEVLGVSLKSGNTTSCGCLHREQLVARNTKHGRRHCRLYGIWLNMKQRCSSDKPRYKAYNGRNISVCPEWKDSYIAFETWAYAHGYEDSLTIDRIDVNGNYCPENCRWISKQQQAYNKTNTRYFTYKGETKCVAEWAEYALNIKGINKHTFINRLYGLGWSIEKALETEVSNGRRNLR